MVVRTRHMCVLRVCGSADPTCIHRRPPRMPVFHSHHQPCHCPPPSPAHTPAHTHTPMPLAEMIRSAILQWKMNHFTRKRNRKTFMSLVRIFGAQVVVVVAFFAAFIILLTVPALYTGVPGGEGLAALALRFVAHVGMAKQRTLLSRVNPTIAPICSHLHMVISESLQMTLFGLARSSEAVVALILVDVVLWVCKLLSLHPGFVKLVYSDTWCDGMWHRHFVRTTALNLAMHVLAKVTVLATWGPVYAAQYYLWNQDKMAACSWGVDFQQAFEYSLIGKLY